MIGVELNKKTLLSTENILFLDSQQNEVANLE